MGESYLILAGRLASIAQQFHFARATEAIQYTSKLILDLPVSNAVRAIGWHYGGISSLERREFEAAQEKFERVVAEGTPVYKARALQGLGAAHRGKGDIDCALRFYRLAATAARDSDPATLLSSVQMSAVVQATLGDHESALKNLVSVRDLAGSVSRLHPLAAYKYVNSLAIEMGECGRFNEALQLTDITLASPLATAYPEWRETREELFLKRESCVVSVSLEPVPESPPRSKAEAEPASQPKLKAEAEPAPKPETDSMSCRVIRPWLFLPPDWITSPLLGPRIIFSRLTLFRSVAQRRLFDRFGMSVLPRSPPAYPGD
jgi:hypothetical protein